MPKPFGLTWYAWDVYIHGYYVGVILEQTESEARLLAWDWFGVSTPYIDDVRVTKIGPVDRRRVLRPWLTKGRKINAR